MKLHAYVTFKGECEAAFQFYEKVLGGKIEAVFKFAGTPMADQAPSGWADKVMHASITVAGTVLMGSDAPPGQYEAPTGTSLSLNTTDVAESERVFAQLAEGGSVTLPLQETFWAARFGMVTDKFGIPWMINCGQPGQA
jgi:PhnB protein